jgi:ribonuclease HI
MTEAQDQRSATPHKYELVFDGGSRGNPGSAYGSYRLKPIGGRARKPVRLSLGRGTNNEAEYLTLINALQAILGELDQTGVDPGSVSLRVFGDSQLVIRQLQGQWKAKDARMRALRDQARELGALFGSIEFQHHDRWRSVAALGH